MKYENRCSQIQLARYHAKLRSKNSQAVQTGEGNVTKQLTKSSPMTNGIFSMAI
jgi:hypothetical protein